MLGVLFYESRQHDHTLWDSVWIDKWCSCYGVTPVMVDVGQRSPFTDRPPYRFPSVEDAVAYFPDHQFIWLEAGAAQDWDGVELPLENVIYCIGDDYRGHYGFSPPAGDLKIRLCHPNKEMEGGEWFATMVAPLLLFRLFR